MSCCFFDKINTLTVLSAMPVATTAPESEMVMQFKFLYVFSMLICPIVGKSVPVLPVKTHLWVNWFSIFSESMGSSWGMGIRGS